MGEGREEKRGRGRGEEEGLGKERGKQRRAETAGKERRSEGEDCVPKEAPMIESVYEGRKVRRSTNLMPACSTVLSFPFRLVDLAAPVAAMYYTLLSNFLPMQVRTVECSKPVPLHHHTTTTLPTQPPTIDTHTPTNLRTFYTWYVDQCLGRMCMSRVSVFLGVSFCITLPTRSCTPRVLSSSLHVCSLCPPILSHPLLSIPHPPPPSSIPPYSSPFLIELTDVAAPHTFHSTILHSPPLAIRFTPTRPILPLPSHPRCRNANVSYRRYLRFLQTQLYLSSPHGTDAPPTHHRIMHCT